MAKEDDTGISPFGYYSGAPMKMTTPTGELVVLDVLPRHSAAIESAFKYGRQIAVQQSGVWFCPILQGRCNDAQVNEIASMAMSFVGMA